MRPHSQGHKPNSLINGPSEYRKVYLIGTLFCHLYIHNWSTVLKSITLPLQAKETGQRLVIGHIIRK
jgi:hypothetical protein